MLPIPNGWRELTVGEIIKKNDQLSWSDKDKFDNHWELVNNLGWVQPENNKIKKDSFHRQFHFITKKKRIKFDSDLPPKWE